MSKGIDSVYFDPAMLEAATYGRKMPNRTVDMLLSPGAKSPKRANPTDAGADLYPLLPAEGVIKIEPNTQLLVDTGVSVRIPIGYAGFLHARSSQRNKGITCWGTGIIDSDYRGTIKVVLANTSDVTYLIDRDTKIAQLVIQKVDIVDFVDTWNETDRGTGSFGSTGK